MKRAGWFALVALVCAPMVFSLFLLTAALWPKMDGLTQKMPVGFKAMIAGAIVRLGSGSDAENARAEKLDYDAAKKSESFYMRRRYNLVDRTAGGTMTADQSGRYTEILEDKAKTLEEKHNFCGAEDLYQKAASAVASSNEYWHTQDMGRNALLCGDLPGARAALEASLEKADLYVKGIHDDADDLQDTKDDIRGMQEMLVVVYDRQHEQKLSAASCKASHPEWKKCGCSVKDGNVSCVEKK